MKVLVELEVDDVVLTELLAKHRAQTVTQITRHGESAPTPAQLGPHRWLRLGEAAEYVTVSATMLRTACARNTLRHVRVDGRRSLRFLAQWVDEWLEREKRG